MIFALLAIAVLCGGGGVRYGLTNLIVQLSALVILAVHGPSFVAFWKAAPFPLRTLVAASLLLPLLQVVPLPPEFWTSIPGRKAILESYKLIGAEES